MTQGVKMNGQGRNLTGDTRIFRRGHWLKYVKETIVSCSIGIFGIVTVKNSLKTKLESLSFRDNSDILKEVRLGGVAERLP